MEPGFGNGQLGDTKEETITQDLIIENNDEKGNETKMLSFVAAVKVAQWVAKAYGYVALRRREYLQPSRVSTSMVGKCA